MFRRIELLSQSEVGQAPLGKLRFFDWKGCLSSGPMLPSRCSTTRREQLAGPDRMLRRAQAVLFFSLGLFEAQRASATISELGHRAPMPVHRSHGICLVSRWSRLRDEPTHQLYEQASAVVQQPAME